MKKVVALFAFNRPEKTLRVFDAIRLYQPEVLYLILDGSRPHKIGEAEACQKVKDILTEVNWKCEVIREYSNVNLGCRQRIVSGLNRIFQEQESTIILEDDCLPDPSFFDFCHELLVYYKDHPKIMAISGDNFQIETNRYDSSYYFTRYFHCWGWATWKRAWALYDVEMKDWKDQRSSGLLKKHLRDPAAVSYWKRTFDLVYQGKLNTWSQQFVYSCFKNEGLCINPSVNLVENLGIDGSGENSVAASANKMNKKSQQLTFPLIHPSVIQADDIKDSYTQKNVFGGNLIQRICKRIFG